MRYLKLICLFSLLSFNINKSAAQGLGIYGNIEGCTISQTHLSIDNKIKLNAQTTPIAYQVSLSRSTNGSGFYPVEIIIGLGYLKDGNYLFFDGKSTITGGDFPTGQIMLTKQLTANVDPTKLNPSDKIFLVYEIHKPGFPSSSWRVEKYPVNSAGYGYELPVTVFYNAAKSASLVKNDCPSGSAPDEYTYTIYSVPAKKYTSTISQADADAKAMAEINSNGQNKANTDQSCIYFGNIRTPIGSKEINYYDYITEIKWNQSSFSGTNVKIELYSSDQLNLIREIISSTPNTGSLKNAIVGLKNSAVGGRIKITSLNDGVSYFSNIFYLEQD